ncbi:unnamed protein product [Discula destructiva]
MAILGGIVPDLSDSNGNHLQQHRPSPPQTCCSSTTSPATLGQQPYRRRWKSTAPRDRGQTNVRDTKFVLDLEDLEAGWRLARWARTSLRLVGEETQAVSTGVFNEMEVFDTATETWTRLAPMRPPRHGTSAVAVGGRVYVPGGGTVQGAAPVDLFDVYVPSDE